MTKSIDPERLEKLLSHAREIVANWYQKNIYVGCPEWPCDEEPYGVSIARFMLESYEEIKNEKMHKR